MCCWANSSPTTYSQQAFLPASDSLRIKEPLPPGPPRSHEAKSPPRSSLSRHGTRAQIHQSVSLKSPFHHSLVSPALIKLPLHLPSSVNGHRDASPAIGSWICLKARGCLRCPRLTLPPHTSARAHTHKQTHYSSVLGPDCGSSVRVSRLSRCPGLSKSSLPSSTLLPHLQSEQLSADVCLLLSCPRGQPW